MAVVHLGVHLALHPEPRCRRGTHCKGLGALPSHQARILACILANELILVDDVERPVQQGDQRVNHEDQVIFIVVEAKPDHGIDQAQELDNVGVKVRLKGFLHTT